METLYSPTEHKFNRMTSRCRCGSSFKTRSQHLEHVVDLAYRIGYDEGVRDGYEDGYEQGKDDHL